MKKVLMMFVVAVMSLTATTASAQTYIGTGAAEKDNLIFNHLSAGIGVGTDGLYGLEVAAPLTQFVSVRTGFAIMPQFKFDVKDVKYDKSDDTTGTVDGRLKIKKGDFKLLFDIHPIPGASFRITTGFYAGQSEFATLENTSPVEDYANSFIKLGNSKRIGFDSEGYTKVAIEVNSFKPYLGLGFGRAVKKVPGLAFNFDAGVQFWGSPKLKAYDMDASKMVEITEDDVEGVENNKDFKDALKTMHKFSVWPVLNFRLTYTIF